MTVRDRLPRAHRSLNRLVHGVVRDAIAAHPDYFTARGRRLAPGSITKRACGAILGFTEQSAKGRSGNRTAPAADQAAGRTPGSASGLRPARAGIHLPARLFFWRKP